MKAFQLWSRFLYIVQFPMIGFLSVMLVFLPGGVDAGGWVTVIVFYMMGPLVVLLAVIAVMTTIRAVAKRAALIAPVTACLLTAFYLCAFVFCAAAPEFDDSRSYASMLQRLGLSEEGSISLAVVCFKAGGFLVVAAAIAAFVEMIVAAKARFTRRAAGVPPIRKSAVPTGAAAHASPDPPGTPFGRPADAAHAAERRTRPREGLALGDAAGAGNATRSGPSHEGGKWNTWCVSVSLGMPGLRPELNVLSARKKTRQITVGDVAVGGDAPISVQSMTTTKTHDIGATLQQIAELTAAGCDIVRVACPTDKDASALPVIAKQSRIPVIADIHFQPRYVFAAIEAGCGAVRVNPGNIRKFDDKVADICKAAADHGTSLRIGVNAGSLDPRLLRKYGSATPEALVESAVWEASLFEECGFHDFKISVKHHDVVTMVQAYRMLSERGDWPLHLGVTEAGPAFQGTIKSAAAFGALLAEGVGDTIRVSLSAPPVEEVKVGSKLLEFMGLRPRKLEIVSCPSCGRAQVDVWTLAESVEEGLKGIAAPLRVAVMGCVVNGPGEAREADLGCASGNGKGKIFVRGEVVATVPEDQIVETLLRFAADMAEEMGTPEDGATGPIVETY